jgi:LCP family protein required for cell wall assembly
VLVAIGVGLGGGLLLAGPLSQLLSENGAGTNNAITNPFAAWSGITNQDILLLGTDVGGGNTDVIASLRVDGGVTRITQVPRDTFVESADYGVLKANALYAFGGMGALKQELTTLLGAPVDRYVRVNLRAVEHLADALGGVEVDVPKRMYYVDNAQNLYIDLYPGRQVLKGEQLEGFLRFRHDELGDLGRMERQKLVLAEVFRKLAQPATLARLPELLKIADDSARGRVVSILEGGYSLEGLASGSAAHVRTLMAA